MRPKGGLSSSGTQNMQSSTGQYSTQAGEPAHPVQHSVMTANSFGFFFRGVNRPFDLGSNLNSSGTIPAGFSADDSADMTIIIPYRPQCLERTKTSNRKGRAEIVKAREQAPGVVLVRFARFAISLCALRVKSFRFLIYLASSP